MTITVHHLNASRSQRVLWLLEELDVPYEVKKYQRDPKTMRAPQSLKEVHPLGKSPVITDGTTVVAESGLICEYLTENYGKGKDLKPPAGSPEELRYRYWMHFSEGTAVTPAFLALLFGKLRTDSPWFIRPVASAIAGGVMSSFVQPEMKLVLGYCNDELSKTGWFCGDHFTAADVEMSFPLEKMMEQPPCPAPQVQAWLDKIRARPAFKRALEKGDKELQSL